MTIERAARALKDAEHLLLCAGAGMGVDSGLPDFRGSEGFWNAYPAYKNLGLRFEELAYPGWFKEDPHFAWGFYGHRLNLYRETTPHDGFSLMLKWSQNRDTFVFTSNVDGHFQKAGFDSERIYEVHGAIDYLQCSRGHVCGSEIWPAPAGTFSLNENLTHAADPLPECPRCGAVARPNILMFGDFDFNGARCGGQEWIMRRFLRELTPSQTIVVECGAGGAIPTVRRMSENLQRKGATLIRINPREPEGPKGTLSFAAGALETLRAIDEAQKKLGD